MATKTATKREFTQADVQYCIRKSAEHCAWLLNHRGGDVRDDYTANELISILKKRSLRIGVQNSSFKERGSVQSINCRLNALEDAIDGDPSRSWLFYWTKQ